MNIIEPQFLIFHGLAFLKKNTPLNSQPVFKIPQSHLLHFTIFKFHFENHLQYCMPTDVHAYEILFAFYNLSLLKG